MDRAREFVLGQQEPEPEGTFISVFNCLPNEVCYGYAGISAGLAVLCFLCCFFLLPTLVLSPASFVMCFTFAMIFIILSLAFLHGLRLYMKKLFTDSRKYASILLIISILAAFYFSVINPKYFLSIICCVLEFNAVLYYFFNTSAVTWDRLKMICQVTGRAVKSQF